MRTRPARRVLAHLYVPLIDVYAPGVSEGIVGSPLYISPEVITGEIVDHRSDIYSLGATFYHVFTGYPPFEGTETKEVLLKHVNENLIPPKEKNAKVSVHLSRIIERMMAKDPEDRYQNYQDIIHDLQFFRSMVLKAKKEKKALMAPSGKGKDQAV